MKRTLWVVLAAALAVLIPVLAEAQWTYPYPHYQPYIILEAPPVVAVPQPPQVIVHSAPQPHQQIIILDPTKWQVSSAPAPAPPTRAAATVQTKVEAAGGVQVNTTCASCTVTNTVNVGQPKPEEPKVEAKPSPKPAVADKKVEKKTEPVAEKKNGNGDKETAEPSTKEPKGWFSRPIDDYMVIGVTALAAALIAAIIMWIIAAGRRPSGLPGTAGPIAPPQPWPAPSAPAPAAAPVGAPATAASDGTRVTVPLAASLTVDPVNVVFKPSLRPAARPQQ